MKEKDYRRSETLDNEKKIGPSLKQITRSTKKAERSSHSIWYHSHNRLRNLTFKDHILQS